jgi:hypothetical protein
MNELLLGAEYIQEMPAIIQFRICVIMSHLKYQRLKYTKKNNITCSIICENYLRHLWANCQGNVGPLMSHNPIGLHGLLQG